MNFFNYLLSLFFLFSFSGIALGSLNETYDQEFIQNAEAELPYDFDLQEDEKDPTVFDYDGSFHCSLQTSVFRDHWFDRSLDALTFCGNFGQFSEFCQFREDQGRFHAIFQFQRLFEARDNQSYSRSRGRAFGQYYDFFTRHKFFGREYQHRWSFTTGCY